MFHAEQFRGVEQSKRRCHAKPLPGRLVQIVPRGTIVKTDTGVWWDLRRITVTRSAEKLQYFGGMGVGEIWGVGGKEGVGVASPRELRPTWAVLLCPLRRK